MYIYCDYDTNYDIDYAFIDYISDKWWTSILFVNTILMMILIMILMIL
jgi:hypothetical protein